MLQIYHYETEPGLSQPELFPLLSGIANVQIDPAPKRLKAALDTWDGVSDFRESIVEMFPLRSNDRILITCEPGSQFQAWCIHDLPHARWGWSDGDISVIYTDQTTRLATQLHEFLHFLGVDDCYETEIPHHPKTSCTRHDCVMLYGVNSLEFCDSVNSQLEEFNARAQSEHI